MTKNSIPKIVADSAIPFLRGVLEPWAEVRYLPGAAIGAEDVRTADALVIRTRTRCNEALLGASSVRLIATATIGFDHIDTAWCAARGIRVATAAGCNARGVLQWIGAVLVSLSRRQGWAPRERTLGIVGVGHVGSLVKSYAEAWGFRTVCCDPPREEREHAGFRPLGEVAREADLITFHTPLDDTTRHLADAALLAQMKPGAVVINSSRGEVVDGEALKAPHIAGYSEQGKANATAQAVATLARFFGFPLEGWYPPEVPPSTPRPISWEELCRTIGTRYDIEAESRHLKASPEEFESLRDHYRYRREYF